jgi:hypothetical protein
LERIFFRKEAEPRKKKQKPVAGGDSNTSGSSADFKNHLKFGGHADGENVYRTTSNSRSSRLSNKVVTAETARACHSLR